MRVVVTGQVGLDKTEFLQHVVQLAEERGEKPALFNIGLLMYAEAPDVAPGRILDLPLSRLHSLRRSVFKDVLTASARCPHTIINTHATFRWRHGLFPAFDFDQMQAFDADLYVTLLDNVDRVQRRLVRDGHVHHTLKDLMVWREEEMLATELMSQVVGGHGRFYVWARGRDSDTAAALVRLMFQPRYRKMYLSFPMTHLPASSQLLPEVESFRREMKNHFTCFDPADVEEKELCALALQAAQEGLRSLDVGPPGQRVTVQTDQLMDIMTDIDGQIYARDFKLIDQADMICSLIPADPDGRPVLSSGVERELQHAHEATREVFVIWRSPATPSPFITETATAVFSSAAQAVQYFLDHDYIPRPPAGSLFPD